MGQHHCLDLGVAQQSRFQQPVEAVQNHQPAAVPDQVNRVPQIGGHHPPQVIGEAGRIVAHPPRAETLGAARSALSTSGPAGCYQLVDEAGDGLADGIADDGGGGVVVGRGVAVDDDQARTRLRGDPA